MASLYFHIISLVYLFSFLSPRCYAQQDCRHAQCNVPTCRYPVSIPGRCCAVCPEQAGKRAPSEKCPRADITLPCGDTCRVDLDCPTNQKCCDHGCGKSCRDRVTISSGSCPYGYPKPSTDCEKLSGAQCPSGYYCKYSLGARQADCCPQREYQGYQPPCHNAVCSPVYCSQPYIPQGQCCPVCPPQAGPAPPSPQSQQQPADVCANVLCPDIYCYKPVLPPGSCCYVCPETTTVAAKHQQNHHQLQHHQNSINQQQHIQSQQQQQFQSQQQFQIQSQQQNQLQSQPSDYLQQQQLPPQGQIQHQPQSLAVPNPTPQLQQRPQPLTVPNPTPQLQQQPMLQPQPSPSYQPTMFESLMCAFAFCDTVNCAGSFIPPGECCHVCPPDPCAGVMCSPVMCPNAYIPDGQCCLTCPPELPCLHNGKTYNSGQTFPNSCNNCTCTNGNIYCTNITCEQPCNYNGRIYQSGVTISNTPCQTCTCGNGVIYCTEDICTRTPAPRPPPRPAPSREILTRPIGMPPATRAPPPYQRPTPPRTRAPPIYQRPTPPRTRAPPTYPPPTPPRKRDPCSGVVCPRTTCQVTYQPLGTCCPICLNKGDCLYEGKMFKNGEIKSSNCQKCTCMDGLMVCSNDCIKRVTEPSTIRTTTVYIPPPTTRGPPPAPPPRQRPTPAKKVPKIRGPPPRPPPPVNPGSPQSQTYPQPPLLVQTYDQIQAASNQQRGSRSFRNQAGPPYNPVPAQTVRKPNRSPPGKLPVRAEVYEPRPRVEPSRRTPQQVQQFQYEQMLQGPMIRTQQSQQSQGLTYKDIKDPLPTRIYPNTMAPRFRPRPSPRYPAPRKRTYPPVPPRTRPAISSNIGDVKTDPRADRCQHVQCPKPKCPNYDVPPGECCPICKPEKKLPKKPGECPAVKRVGMCVEFCKTDHDCTGQQICCFNGCKTQCVDPVVKR